MCHLVVTTPVSAVFLILVYMSFSAFVPTLARVFCLGLIKSVAKSEPFGCLPGLSWEF